MVTRNLARDGLNVFLTRYDHLGTLPGYGVLEFPFYNAIVAALYLVFGIHEPIGRAVSVAFGIASVAATYRLAAHVLPPLSALVAAAVVAFSPMHVFMSRAFMPEATMFFFIVVAALLFLRLQHVPTWRTATAAAAALALAILVKVPSILLGPFIATNWWLSFGPRGYLQPRFVGYLAMSLVPPALWNAYGSVVNKQLMADWALDNQLVARIGGLTPALAPEVLGTLARSVAGLAGPVGLVLGITGMVASWRYRSLWPVYTWLGAWSAWALVFATVNAAHPYYQLPMLVPLAIFGGSATAITHNLSRTRARAWLSRNLFVPGAIAVATVLTIAQAAALWFLFAESYDPDKRVPYHLAVARQLRETTSRDASLILNDLNASNTTLTYYADRPSISFDVQPGEKAVLELERLRAERTSPYYVAIKSAYYDRVADTRANAALWRHLTTRYSAIAITDAYLIFDLREPASVPPRQSKLDGSDA